ncbi:hypothetical protein SAMN04487948_11449 [Halogranum amylolyticum]|uniref:Uncharacterized protein n=1 Tax=Halogranum amylolyticum TaxID=660520 RepID=A0A1H8V5F4_9EURY|nr:hypothetical protein SAMN04487948_11449 [Halogranum amylolyticum]
MLDRMIRLLIILITNNIATVLFVFVSLVFYAFTRRTFVWGRRRYPLARNST